MKKRITRRSSENSESGESDHEDGSSMKNNNNNNKPLPKKTALKKAKTTPLVPDVPTVVENSEKEESNEEDIVSEDKVIDDGDDNEDFDDDEDDDEEDDIVTGQIAGPLTPSGTQGPQKGQQSLLEGKLPLSMWQLPERAMLTCFKDLLCWRGRMGKFVSKPLINDKKSDEGQAEMSERIKELRFLVLEYSSLWLYGHSLTSDDERQMDANHTAPNPMAVTFCLFFGKSTELNLTPSAVESAYLPLHQDVMALVEQHKKYKYFDNDNAEHNTSLTKVNNVRTALQQGYYMLLHAAGVSIAIDPHKSAIMPSKNVLHYVENSNHLKDRMAEAKPILQCVLYLLNILSQNRYRRYKDSVYEEHYTAEGYATSFWKRIGNTLLPFKAPLQGVKV